MLEYIGAAFTKAEIWVPRHDDLFIRCTESNCCRMFNVRVWELEQTYCNNQLSGFFSVRHSTESTNALCRQYVISKWWDTALGVGMVTADPSQSIN